MTLTTALAIYFIIWWLVLFAVLPWGIRSQHESDDMVPGTDPGAPIATRLVSKLVWTSLIAALIFIVIFFVYAFDLMTLEQFDSWLGLRSY